MALFKPLIISSVVKSWSSNIVHLDLIAGLILWYGFDVVKPTNVIRPDSKWGSNISCLYFLQIRDNL